MIGYIQATAALVLILYTLVQVARPFISLHGHLRRARQVGLPIKLIPVPPGLFSFFVLQTLRRLNIVKPGTRLDKLLNVGRPDGYGMHQELGDVFLTVSPYGIGLVVADPRVVSHVNGRRDAFPKPPNTGAIIGLYGKNVINADGDVWRFHRRVTGPVFSERIHSAIWDEGRHQAHLMMNSWGAVPNLKDASSSTKSVRIAAPLDDALRLGMHVITGAAYGCPMPDWDTSPPSSTVQTLSYRGAFEQISAHLMPLFLTPHWALRAAPLNTTWGRAWTSYESFRGYMEGMLNRERQLREEVDDGKAEDSENLLTALIRAEEEVDEKEGRKMTHEEVTGNAFIYLFAGHETTANTLHYALCLLAIHQDVQDMLIAEIDDLYSRAAALGRSELDYDIDFGQAVFSLAVMYETLRIYTPTGMTNKWTAEAQPITFDGRSYVIPEHTRISINGTGVHANPSVWGEDALEWRPTRWILEEGIDAMPYQPSSPRQGYNSQPTTPRTADAETFAMKQNYPQPVGLNTPPSTPLRRRSLIPASPVPGSPIQPNYAPDIPTLLRPPKGTFLPFSEGARACSGKKFATVEFVIVISTLLRHHRMELPVEAEGWTTARARKVLSGRKPGALTLQPPEPIPLRFTRR